MPFLVQVIDEETIKQWRIEFADKFCCKVSLGDANDFYFEEFYPGWDELDYDEREAIEDEESVCCADHCRSEECVAALWWAADMLGYDLEEWSPR